MMQKLRWLGLLAGLMIFEGYKGAGFSAQLPPEMLPDIPDLLRHMADQIEEDTERGELK